MIRIFNLYFHKRTLLQVFFDLSLVVGTVVLAVLSQVADPASASSPVISSAVMLAAGLVMVNAGLGFYQRAYGCTQVQARVRVVLSLCFSIPLVYGLSLLQPLGPEDEEIFVLAMVLAVFVVLVHRVYVTHTVAATTLRQRVLIFGSDSNARAVGKALKAGDPNVNLVGYYAGPNEPLEDTSDWGLLTSERTLTEVVIDEQVDEIVVAVSERRGGSMPLRELLDCKLHGVQVVDTATHFEKALGQIRSDSVSAGWLIFGEGFEQGLLRTAVKRVFDILCAFGLLVLALPVMLITAIAICLESGGPILYRQERVGLNGRLFNVVKFRSMRADAEKDGTPRFALPQDARVTRVGKIIRKLRIDELPQLFCVLGGDMSLVGPRPERPYFVDQLTQKIPYYAVRHSVKPGVTGWAQVRYQYAASVDDAAHKLQYDLYYVKNHTLFLDLIVIFETVGVVLMGKGAQ